MLENRIRTLEVYLTKCMKKVTKTMTNKKTSDKNVKPLEVNSKNSIIEHKINYTGDKNKGTQYSISKGNKSKIFILADDNGQNCRDLLTKILDNKYIVTSFFKPGALFEEVISEAAKSLYSLKVLTNLIT